MTLHDLLDSPMLKFKNNREQCIDMLAIYESAALGFGTSCKHELLSRFYLNDHGPPHSASHHAGATACRDEEHLVFECSAVQKLFRAPPGDAIILFMWQNDIIGVARVPLRSFTHHRYTKELQVHL